jgi:hypothetical protein
MRGLLIVLCTVALGALARAQEPDRSGLSEALRALREQPHTAPADVVISAVELLRKLNGPERFRNFSEFRGTWVLDEKATAGIRYAARPSGEQIPFDAIGMEIARRIVITGTDTQIVLTKDDAGPELYRFDGTEQQATDPQSGALLDPRHSFALVAGALALTSRTTNCCDAGQPSSTRIVTDAYRLAEFDVLTIERQFSMLREPAGSLMTLSRLRGLPFRITYRRVP